MSDSEAPGAPAGSDEVVPQPSPVTPDASSPQTPDETSGEVSADVAPSRKTRRRPETKPPVEVQEETQVKPNAVEETATVRLHLRQNATILSHTDPDQVTTSVVIPLSPSSSLPPFPPPSLSPLSPALQ